METFWFYAGRATWFALVLMVVGRLLDRHTLGSQKPYDFAINITFGTVAGTGTLDPRIPVAGTTVAIGVLALFGLVTNALTFRVPGLARWLVGQPVTIVRDGHMVPQGLRRLHLTERDAISKLRELKIAELADVELAEMEPDGRLGLVMRNGKRGR